MASRQLTTECIENVIMMVPFSAVVMWTFEEKIGKGWKKILWYSGKIAFIFSVSDRDVAIIASLGYVPAIRHLLQHSRWNDWRFNVLWSDEGKKASVKEYNKKQRTAIGALEG